jgi:UDP-glucose 4-epimerase
LGNNNILVTGISGFVGYSVAECFTRRGYFVTGLSTGNVNVPWTVQATSYTVEGITSLIQNIRPEIIIHCAGPASVGGSMMNPSEDFAGSVSLFHSILEGASKSGLKPLVIFPSSAAVYGNPEILPVTETAAIKPISPYGYHKVMCELLAKEYALCFNIPALVVRLFSVFGPRQKRLLLWEVFNQFINKPEVIIEGTGNESRDYIYIDDLADSLINLIPKLDNNYTVLNIASGNSVTVRELTTKIKKYLNSKKPVSFKGIMRPGDPTHWCADISLLESITGKRVFFNFDERLEASLDQWLKQLNQSS